MDSHFFIATVTTAAARAVRVGKKVKRRSDIWPVTASVISSDASAGGGGRRN